MPIARIVLLTSLALILGQPAFAQAGDDPITRFCGPEPKADPQHGAPVKVAQRLLDRILTTRQRVFTAYRHEYNQNREQIIRRNKRLPKSQHITPPPPRSDDELRAMDDYRERERKAHASPADEQIAQQRLAEEVAKVDAAEARYQSCRQGILERIRLAPNQNADEIRKRPSSQRLREEQQRLDELKINYLTMIETKRKDRGTMTPILSAAICGHKNRKRALQEQERTVKRQAKLAGTDPSSDLQRLREQQEDHGLEIIELNRDLKIFHSRAQRCAGALAPLVQCIESQLQTPSPLPPSCKGFETELELIGYAKRPWD